MLGADELPRPILPTIQRAASPPRSCANQQALPVRARLAVYAVPVRPTGPASARGTDHLVRSDEPALRADPARQFRRRLWMLPNHSGNPHQSGMIDDRWYCPPSFTPWLCHRTRPLLREGVPSTAVHRAQRHRARLTHLLRRPDAEHRKPGGENGDNAVHKGKASHGQLWIILDNEA